MMFLNDKIVAKATVFLYNLSMKTTSKIIRCDLHMHTNFSFDSQATMEQYAQRALEIGADVICFTDHIDINRRYNTFEGFQFERRRDEFDRIRDEYCDRVKMLYGFEIGEPHLHPEVMEKVYEQQPDMIIGSVHDPLYHVGIDYIIPNLEYERLYNECVCQMVAHGGFDVLGHADMPKKYHRDYVEDFDYIAETLHLCVLKGIVPEINTSSLRNDVKDTMPSLKAIEHYVKCGGRYVVINSDSHTPESLCYALEQTRAKLPNGARLCYFENRKIVSL